MQHTPDTPGQTDKPPLVLPLRTALFGNDSGTRLGDERLILLDKAEDSVTFDKVGETPLLSINRGFSAPVVIDARRAPGELERLAEIDDDPFARFEAGQDMMMRALLAGAKGEAMDLDPVVAAMGATLRSNALDPAFKAEALMVPGEGIIAERLAQADPMTIHAARDALRAAAGAALADDLASAQAEVTQGDDLSSAAKGRRKLRTVALGLIAAADKPRAAALAKAQYDAADNMTDRQGALGALAIVGGDEAEAAFADFYDRFRDDTLVIDKWFALQATATRDDTLDRVGHLLGHADFTFANPNRLRSVAAFAGNPYVLHSENGRGYRLLGRLILEAEKLNPQVAARMVPPLGRWRRLVEPYGGAMKAELERILATPGLSKDVFEQVSKSLA